MTIPNPIIIIGIGEMAGVFARAFLKAGYPVIPVNRHTDIDELSAHVPQPAFTLLAVAEKDLHSSLQALPPTWRTNLALLQNELLPRDWKAHDIQSPTVISVWFEKKKGQDYKVLVPSPVFGPKAGIIVNSLKLLDIPAWELKSEEQLLFELVRKNVYILTTNISGLMVGGNVEQLWNQHQELARAVASDVIDIQDWLSAQTHDREKLIAGMVSAIEGDPEHRCMGRSAPARLATAIKLADQAGLEVSKLREILKTQ